MGLRSLLMGGSRAYTDGYDYFVQSSGTGSAGITGGKVWVEDSKYGSVEMSTPCSCKKKNRGKRCHCECHGGRSKRH